MQSEYKEKQDDAKGKFQSDIQKLGLRLQSLMFLSIMEKQGNSHTTSYNCCRVNN